MKQTGIFILFLLLINFYGFGQTDTNEMVRYDFYYQFKDGLYLEFSNLKNNNPVTFERIVYPPYEDFNFFDSLTSVKTISYYDNFGNIKEIEKSKIWGYSRNGRPYVFWANKFYLIPSIGSIAHFAAIVKIYHSNYYDPFYGYHYDYNYYPPRTYQTEELRQFLIDFKTGEIYPYDAKSVEKLLSKEPELHAEFIKLNKRKKNKRMLEYTRRYNEKNPLYLLKN
jgi:hypothetical protein